MEDAIVNPVTNSVTNYVFGAFCLILLSTLIACIKFWRGDNKETSAAMLDNSVNCTEALTKNAAANEKLSVGLDTMTRSFNRLQEELIRRPCFIEDEDEGA